MTESKTGLIGQLRPDDAGTQLDVRVSYEIIKLFSEGLYQSPHKAIEELVTNSFDAGARNAHVLVPQTDNSEDPDSQESLWVIDDGSGMDADGFVLLWRVALSTKYDQAVGDGGRAPIGQFGIGKLAAYVLAWRLTHISKHGGSIRYTSMNFHTVTNRHQYEAQEKPLTVGLHEINEDEAKRMLAEVEARDSAAWEMMFGESAAPSWTAAAMSEFKGLFAKLREGTLGWVLRTGLPLSDEFAIHLNGDKLVPSKAEFTVLTEYEVGSADDEVAQAHGLDVDDGVVIPGVGKVTGQAQLFERPLTSGKSEQYGRSHGFFVRVRGRVINLADELFGLDVLNHAAWSRFAMFVDADGLRKHLLSSREGVRDSDSIRDLRKYLHGVFNACRKVYEQERRRELVGLDIQQLLADAPSTLAIEPLVRALRTELLEAGRQLYYIRAPADLSDDEAAEWLDKFEDAVSKQPFEALKVAQKSPYEPLAEYDAESRVLTVNEAHPFMSKMIAHSKNQTPITLLASSEVLTDALIREFGLDSRAAVAFFDERDQALRLLAGEHAPDAAEVLRQLKIADDDRDALELAVGEAFSVLGMTYEKRGGSAEGPDGVLDARLGRQRSELGDFRLVYDTKTTSKPAVPADKVDLASLWDFKKTEGADHAFVVAKAFQGQDNADSKINRKLQENAAQGQPVTAILTEDVARIVGLHLKCGVTLTRLRSLFDMTTCMDAKKWVNDLEKELQEPGSRVPLKLLLDKLEEVKRDTKATPNVHAVRAPVEGLKEFTPERLIAALKALETLVGTSWLEVDGRSGEVVLHQASDQIVAEMERRLADDLGLQAEE